MQESTHRDMAAPDILHLLMLIDESKVALRSLAEMVPDPEAIEGLYHYVHDALDTIAAGLAELKLRPVESITGAGQFVRSIDQQAVDDNDKPGQRTRLTR